MKNILLVMSLVFTLVACSNSSSDESYSYEYTLNGCPTGQQTFSSLKDMCAGLADDERNNFCADTLRCQRFQSDCQQYKDELGVNCFTF